MGLSAGTQLGPYEVLGPLGSGGMGEVYRARDTRLGRQVAVKILPDAVSQDPRRVALFETETRSLAALSHPNVLAIHDVGRVDGRLYAVTELLDGETLRSRMADETVSWRKAAEVAAAIADGLASAHAAGIVHRDLKPENVFLTTDGRLKILDFGLATYAEPALDDAVTLTSPSGGTLSGDVVGTLSYMAPEQLRGRRVDGRTDIFALGCVLYEMLAERRPFTGATPADTLAAILHHDPEPFAPGAPGIPPGLQTIVFRCLEKRPEDRYDTAHDLAIALRGISAEQAAVRSGESPRPARPRRGTRLVALGIGSVAALASLLLVVKLPRTSGAGPAEVLRPNPPRQITSTPGWDADPALSPDGTLIAYGSNAAGTIDIWLVDVQGGEPLRLTSGLGEVSKPAWFPDGRSVAFVRNVGGRKSVWKVPRLGGSPIPVVEDADMPAISPDGKSIAFVRVGTLGPRIWTASLDRPVDAKQLTADADGLWDHIDPAWSPDGATICYSDFRHLWLIDVASGKARQLTLGDVTDREPVWSASGDFIYSSSHRDNADVVHRVSVPAGTVTRYSTGPGPERHPAVSRDGRLLVYSAASSNRNILVLDRRAGSTFRFGSARRDEMPAMAPDGSAVAFVSDRMGKFDLWYQPMAGGKPSPEPPRRLTDFASGLATPAFSPDGRWVACFRVVKGERDIWLIPVSGGPAVRLTEHTGRNVHPVFSPDGSRLAFVSSRAGPEHVWIMPMDGVTPSGEPWQLTEGEAEDQTPTFSPSGEAVAFIRGDDIWLSEARPGAKSRRVTTRAEIHYAVWDVDGRRLLATGTWGGPDLELRTVHPESGAIEPLKPRLVLGGRDALGILGLSRDGRYLAVDFEEMKGNLWTVESPGRRP